MTTALFGKLVKRNCRMIKKEYIFPVILIALDVGAGIVYGAAGDYKKLVYWIAAAVLNIAVTF